MKTIQSVSMIMALFAIFSCKETVQQSSPYEYEFVGGYPTSATIEKAYKQLDVQRATQVYIDFMKRVFGTYIISLIVVALILTLIQKCLWGIDNALALK